MVQPVKQFGASLMQPFSLWFVGLLEWNILENSDMTCDRWLIYHITYDLFTVRLIRRRSNLFQSISTQNSLFWVVPTVHTQCSQNDATRAAPRKCSVSSVAGRIQISYEAFSKLVSILFNFAVFFSLFSDTEGKTGVEPVQTSLSFLIRYSLYYVWLLASTKIADTNNMALSSRFAWKQWNTNLQLPNTNIFTTDKRLAAAPCHPCGCCCPSWRFPPMASLLQAKLNCVRLSLPGKPTGRGSHQSCKTIWLVRWFFCRHGLYD